MDLLFFSFYFEYFLLFIKSVKFIYYKSVLKWLIIDNTKLLEMFNI